jgi:aspartyl-tRNA(Asn)/glutamyl-tRNA(Gln) amidotransferase subunit A
MPSSHMPLPTTRPELLRCVNRVADACRSARDAEALNAFIELFEERALQEARRVDAAIQTGAAGPLAGTTMAVKDNIAIAGRALTCASRMLEGYVAERDATVIARVRAADAIIVGRTNMDEFAMGSSSEWSAFGPVRSPLDPERVAGGSSGGSAAAVAAGIVDVALGSDTGGSVRQPAAFTGIAGFKPTYGRFSRSGLVAFASSFDSVGVLARNTSAIVPVARVMSGHDPLDATSLAEGPIGEPPRVTLRGVRIGLPREWREVDVPAPLRRALEDACRRLREQGAIVDEVSLASLRHALPVYHILAMAEASANLARYDGMRYGRRDESDAAYTDAVVAARSRGFGPEVRRRILLGTYVLTAGYRDRTTARAQALRAVLRGEMAAAFAHVDLLLSLTAPETAFRLGERREHPVDMYRSDVFTVPANLAGLPAISLPWGCDTDGLPIGLQLMAAERKDAFLLGAATVIERLAPEGGIAR